MGALGNKAAFDRRVREFRKFGKKKPEFREFVDRNIEDMLEDVGRQPGNVEQLAYFNGWMTGILDALD